MFYGGIIMASIFGLALPAMAFVFGKLIDEMGASALTGADA